MHPAVDPDRDEALRRDIETLLTDIDAELARTPPAGDGSDAGIEQLKQRMRAPSFLAKAASGCDLPSSAVSIVMPTRNRASVIAEAIVSIQAQSYTDWELIIVDDGSNDGTDNAISALLSDPRIRYVAQEFSGHSAARNRALREARGTLVAYLDSDNLWYPNFLAAALTVLRAYPDSDCIYGALDTPFHVEARRTMLFERFDRNGLLRQNFIDLNTLVHRRALIDAYGGFDENLDRMVDWDLVLKFTQDKPARRVPVLAARYRVVDDQRVSVTRPHAPNFEAIRRKWHSEAP
jgi:glycosyltransferase involved in cell wall biosynthesis